MARPPLHSRIGLILQRNVGWLLGLVWIPLTAFFLRVIMGYQVRNAAEHRRRFRRLVEEDDRPLLICANHLTLIDSLLVAWGLGGSWWYLFNYSRLPWNLPERDNFSSDPLSRAATWLAKCIPVNRGGSREGVSKVMSRLRYVLSRGEAALIFPEGGRSRTGQVEPDSATYGVGRVLNAIPGCRTLCVYMRGDRQESWSDLPARGSAFYLDFEVFEPESEHTGLRRARDVSRQIVERLSGMEEEYRADRQ